MIKSLLQTEFLFRGLVIRRIDEPQEFIVLIQLVIDPLDFRIDQLDLPFLGKAVDA